MRKINVFLMIGEFLLIDALQLAHASSAVTGAAVIVVDAKSKAVGDFYLQYGFKPFIAITNRLFIPMATVQKIVPQPGLS